MGYYVRIEDSTWVIPEKNLDAAYQAMCDLNKHDELKSGGSWSGSKQNEKWFAWMDANYPETCKDAAAILDQLGFELHFNENGDLCIDWYDNKIGSEELFLRAIAPFSVEDSYIVWRGEDGAIWRHIVQRGTLVEQTGTVTFA